MNLFAASSRDRARRSARPVSTTAAGALALAAVIAGASPAHAQISQGAPAVANQVYRPATAANAKAALNAYFSSSPNCATCRVGGGEDLLRDISTGGSMMWHDANTVEMILDYYEATLAAVFPDATLNGVAQSYKGYNPREPFNILNYFDPLQAVGRLQLGIQPDRSRARSSCRALRHGVDSQPGR